MSGVQQILIASAALSPWTPINLTTQPAIWLNNQSAVTDISGNASQWNDLSANAFHMAQGTAGNRPLIVSSGLNSLRTIRFDGTNDFLDNSSSGALDIYRNKSYGWAAMVVKKLASDGAFVNRAMFGASVNGAAGTSRFVCTAATTTKNTPALAVRRLDADSVGVLNDSGESGTAWRMILFRMDWANGDGFIDVNGANTVSNTSLTSTGSTSNTASAAAIAIGALTQGSGSAVNFADIEVAEFVTGNASISAGEIDKIFGYLAWKWGLVADLPALHPYKSAPPYA